jgi:hypothetical protein
LLCAILSLTCLLLFCILSKPCKWLIDSSILIRPPRKVDFVDAVERRKIRWAVVDAKPEGLLESLHATNRALCSATGADSGGGGGGRAPDARPL